VWFFLALEIRLRRVPTLDDVERGLFEVWDAEGDGGDGATGGSVLDSSLANLVRCRSFPDAVLPILLLPHSIHSIHHHPPSSIASHHRETPSVYFTPQIGLCRGYAVLTVTAPVHFPFRATHVRLA
jgi:hypothetical protein